MRSILFAALLISLFTSACNRSVSTIEPYTGKNPFTPAATAHPCTADDLQTSSNAHSDAGAVTLGVTLINQSQNPCTMQPPPQINLLDADKPLDIKEIQTGADKSPLSIAPGESLIVILAWDNYCGAVLKDDPNLQLKLTEGETLTVKANLKEPPRCHDSNAPSTLTINPYSYPP